jgi:pyridoxamine 5'-phosphate oxidase
VFKVFQLASIDSTTNTPHVRSHIHREFLTPEAIPSLPLLLTSTDIRTPKNDQILAIPTVEIVFWAVANQEQYRIRGNASIIPTPSHRYHAQFDPLRGPTLTALNREGLDWELKRRDVFNAMNGRMKATWCTPLVPGTKLEGGYEEMKKWPRTLPKLGEADNEEDKKNLEIALRNFALIVIDPFEVDFVELGVDPNQRTKFTRDGEQWMEEIVVP